MKFARWTLTAALATAAALGYAAQGRDAQAKFAADAKLTGVVDDWTTRHVAFSNPGTRQDALKKGKLDRWTRVTNDTRYQMQALRRAKGSHLVGGAGPGLDANIDLIRNLNRSLDPGPGLVGRHGILGGVHRIPRVPRLDFPRYRAKNSIVKDWSVALGGGGAIPATVEPNAFPAKYGASLTSASCSDFVVYPTGQPGSSSAATIIAYTNLYSGCGGTVPKVAWAYNTGDGYAVTTSPTLSLDGSEVIFVESNGTNSELVALAWALSTTETLTSPGSPMSVTNIAGCATACMATSALSSLDTYSAPYYAYFQDAVFVGTDSGTIDKIAPVISGAMPATAASTSLTGAGYVASPVFDPNSGCVFVGDSNGYVYSVNSGIGGGTTCTGAFGLFGHSGQLAAADSEGIYDAPLLDPSAGTFYVFVSESTSNICTDSEANCVAEFQTTTISQGDASALPVEADPLGAPSIESNPIYSGAFDNTYYSSTGGTGNLYVVGGTGTTTAAALFRVPINSGAINGSADNVVTGLTGGAGYPWPSPATEFYNANAGAGTDYLFFSVNDGAQSGCTNSAGNGCILSYNITTTTVSLEGTGQNFVTPGADGCWATGGIVIDNDATTTGASQIYLVNLNGADAGSLDGSGAVMSASSNCTAGAITSLQAIQASQSAQ